jgi:hypothetical protein
MLGQMRGGTIQRDLAVLQRGRNGIVRQAKQQSAFLRRELLRGGFLFAGHRFAAFTSAEF